MLGFQRVRFHNRMEATFRPGIGLRRAIRMFRVWTFGLANIASTKGVEESTQVCMAASFGSETMALPGCPMRGLHRMAAARGAARRHWDSPQILLPRVQDRYVAIRSNHQQAIGPGIEALSRKADPRSRTGLSL